MKIRIDFVTNSSSVGYLVRNLSSKMRCGVPPFTTYSAWEGVGDNEGEGDIKNYRRCGLLIGDENEIRPGKLIIVDSQIKENEFRRLFSSFETYSQIEDIDSTEISTGVIVVEEWEIDPKSINLQFLPNFKKLEKLKIYGLPLVEDWSFIAECGNLQELVFNDRASNLWETISKIDDMDVLKGYEITIGYEWKYWKYCPPGLMQQDFSTAIAIMKGNLNTIADYKWQWLPAQEKLLQDMQMSEIFGYFGNPLDILRRVTHSMDFQSAREAVYDQIIELICSQIEKPGGTLFLDIDKLSTSRGAVLIPDILERRKMEIKEIEVYVMDELYYIGNIWCTYYGFQVLSELAIEKVDKKSFKIIQSKMKDLGAKIKTRKVKKREEIEELSLPPRFQSFPKTFFEKRKKEN